MNLELVRNFLTIAKTGNITHTAQALYVAQSTVSQRLRLLEDELGCCLVRRGRGCRAAELTADGQAFLPLAERWIGLLQETELFKRGQTEQKLTVGCINSVATCLLREFFSALADRYPEIHFNIKLLESDEMYDLLDDRKIDVGIVLHNLHRSTVSIRPLFSEPMVCVVSKAYAPTGETITPQQLDPREEILLSWDLQFDLWHDYWFPGAQEPRMRVNSILLVSSALERGRGWAVVPESVQRFLTAEGVGSPLKVSYLPPDRVSYVITPAAPDSGKRNLIDLFNRELNAYIAKI